MAGDWLCCCCRGPRGDFGWPEVPQKPARETPLIRREWAGGESSLNQPQRATRTPGLARPACCGPVSQTNRWLTGSRADFLPGIQHSEFLVNGGGLLLRHKHPECHGNQAGESCLNQHSAHPCLNSGTFCPDFQAGLREWPQFTHAGCHRQIGIFA